MNVCSTAVIVLYLSMLMIDKEVHQICEYSVMYGSLTIMTLGDDCLHV